MQHDWVKSTLGHGNLMCTRCWTTDLEAMALGEMYHCSVPPPPAANQNERTWTQEKIDDDVFRDTDEDDGPIPGEECGRWRNGSLGQYCAKAGTEECDFECPYRDSECVKC